MELINLLDQNEWDESESFSDKDIQNAMRQNVSDHIKKLYRTYYRGLLLNLAFLVLFLIIYLLNPTVEFLVPVILISSCFAFIVLNLSVKLINRESVDPTCSLKTVLLDSLEFNKKVYKTQCKYNSIILTVSFMGGFLLGLAFQGWTLEKYVDKPVIIPVFLILTIGFYFLTKTQSFKMLNRKLSPNYIRSRDYLEEQLELISRDD